MSTRNQRITRLIEVRHRNQPSYVQHIVEVPYGYHPRKSYKKSSKQQQYVREIVTALAIIIGVYVSMVVLYAMQ